MVSDRNYHLSGQLRSRFKMYYVAAAMLHARRAAAGYAFAACEIRARAAVPSSNAMD